MKEVIDIPAAIGLANQNKMTSRAIDTGERTRTHRQANKDYGRIWHGPEN